MGGVGGVVNAEAQGLQPRSFSRFKQPSLASAGCLRLWPSARRDELRETAGSASKVADESTSLTSKKTCSTPTAASCSLQLHITGTHLSGQDEKYVVAVALESTPLAEHGRNQSEVLHHQPRVIGLHHIAGRRGADRWTKLAGSGR